MHNVSKPKKSLDVYQTLSLTEDGVWGQGLGCIGLMCVQHGVETSALMQAELTSWPSKNFYSRSLVLQLRNQRHSTRDGKQNSFYTMVHNVTLVGYVLECYGCWPHHDMSVVVWYTQECNLTCPTTNRFVHEKWQSRYRTTGTCTHKSLL